MANRKLILSAFSLASVIAAIWICQQNQNTGKYHEETYPIGQQEEDYFNSNSN
ncbi:hypothetical protein ACE1CD_15595 [Aerosakkonema sp. BLCC-F183]|uniref:hypothetical protein n=1 Tax=Aerosakkonema sp. BLCC-F183 TaxID=3342834 RepID=UPI0035B9812F